MQATSSTVIAQDNKALVQRYLEEIINKGEMSVADEILAPDYVNRSSGGGIGLSRNDFVQSLIAMRTAFPDWHVTIEEMVTDGDIVVDRIRISATHTGSVNGVPASGRRKATLAMHMWRVTDGKLAEGWYTTDALPSVTAALVPAKQTRSSDDDTDSRLAVRSEKLST